MLRELITTLMDCRRTDGAYLFGKGRFVKRGFAADPKFELTKCRMIKDSETVTAGVSYGLFIKRYNRKGLWRTLKRSIQLPRSYTCLAAAIHLENTAIATPTVFLASRFYLITEALPPETKYLDKYPDLTETAVPTIAKMHNAGLFHGDLNLRNLYYLNGQYGFIDLDSARLFSKGISRSLRRMELARFISSYARTLRDNHTPLSSGELSRCIKRFADLYQKESGFDLMDAKLEKRIIYLYRRIRKYRR